MGLREFKKEQTRRLLAETAWRMFADRGFEQVKVAEIARAAMVSEATVFKYFPTKEGLFFSGLEDFGDRLIAAVREREPGESALVACRRFLLNGVGGLLGRIEGGDAQALDRLRTINRVITESPTLRAREQQVIAGYTEDLAGLLAEEVGADEDDIGPRVAANALIGVHRTLIGEVRRRAASLEDPRMIATDVHRAGTHAFALLEHGLRDYAIKPAAASQ
ncbi:TetR family transcriptional regulator [Spongiactinospora rosea]|uniref:TetR family transcriptional regulator n=1 Tax=Spongiactinospora rosea TaxID=2248750 RepID=A0A366LXD0_9ACTN|nr:TetR family transcriptional regulator [Spongiactinospora rosea]RBQ18618.1 TetR family transcriptional regulator [Spongiactinospora rosea]